MRLNRHTLLRRWKQPAFGPLAHGDPLAKQLLPTTSGKQKWFRKVKACGGSAWTLLLTRIEILDHFLPGAVPIGDMHFLRVLEGLKNLARLGGIATVPLEVYNSRLLRTDMLLALSNMTFSLFQMFPKERFLGHVRHQQGQALDGSGQCYGKV